MTEAGVPVPGGRVAQRAKTVLLPTAVVGSYSAPDWFGRFRTEAHRGRLSRRGLREIEDVLVKAALLDQELAGIDIVSDGELRRDNDMDYVVEMLPGVELGSDAKLDYFDYYDATVHVRFPDAGTARVEGLVEDFSFLASLTDRIVTVSLPGPFSLSRRLHNLAYADAEDLVLDLAAVLRTAANALVAAGATHLQLDEPFLAGHPELVDMAIRATNVVTAGLEAHVALHVCYGNRYARPAWEGHYDFLFPAVLAAEIDELVLEFARKGLDDLELAGRHPNEFEFGIGVLDVKSTDIEPVELIERRIRRALEILPPERIVVNPDCGLRHLPSSIARQKLETMSAAASRVRAELLGEKAPQPPDLETRAKAIP